VEGGSRAVRDGCPVAVMRIQCFGFGLRVERRWEEVLSEDEAKSTSSSCLHGKEA
jgi:hypothetical protein